MKKESGGGYFQIWESPIGWIGLIAGTSGVREIILQADAEAIHQRLSDYSQEPRPDILIDARRQLEEYFRGERRAFKLPLEFDGLSRFASGILHVLLRVPYGATVTYGELAVLAGFPRAARAVGRVMGRNPLPIVVPCHRVLGTGGRLTGYSGGDGLATKEWLLRFERERSRDKIIPDSKSS